MNFTTNVSTNYKKFLFKLNFYDPFIIFFKEYTREFK